MCGEGKKELGRSGRTWNIQDLEQGHKSKQCRRENDLVPDGLESEAIQGRV